MSNHEIEDVLSSIRRLVSDDIRPATGRGTGPLAEPKLILTPALRVVSTQSSAPVPLPAEASPAAAKPAPMPVVDARFEPMSFAEVLTPDFAAREFVAPEFVAPEFVTSEFSASDFASPEFPSAGFATDMPGAGGGDAPPNAPAPAEPDRSEAVAVSPVPVASPEDAPLMFVHTPADEWRAGPMGGDPLPTSVAWGGDIWDAAPDLSASDSEDALAAVAPFTAGTDLPDEAPMWSDAPDGNPVWDDPTATAWAEEEPIAFVAHRRKADVAANPLALAWADRAEAAVRAELQEPKSPDSGGGATPGKAAPAGAKPADALNDATGGFDEETLRDIVRDILREELAGSLGERITRNVRKLVRVEINRALATREFE